MTVNRGGLNIKDYPFAFTLAALLFPPIIAVGKDATPVLFALVILGGMAGSILTIVNPVGIVIKSIYIYTQRNRILPQIRINKFVEGVIAKNYVDAMKSPAISFEVDKLVAMFYFVIVLSIAAYRLFFDHEFSTLLQLTITQKYGIGITVTLGLVGVIASMIYNVRGWKSVSHLKRTVIVTILLMAYDLANLSHEARKITGITYYNDINMVNPIRKTLYHLDANKSYNKEDFKKLLDNAEIQNVYEQILKRGIWKSELNVRYLQFWNLFMLIKETSTKYKISYQDAIWWFDHQHYFDLNEFDGPSSQLQSTIDARDWQNADLRTTRIIDRIDTILKNKQQYAPLQV